MMNYWLFKSDPDTYGIDDLISDGTTFWDGVRNYQARNILRDEVKAGDAVLFYHSNIASPAVTGTAKVVRAGYPDHTQFDPKAGHYDPKSSKGNPRWFMVDISYELKFPHPVTIDEIKDVPALQGMVLLNNSRLSVQPVTKSEWERICRMGTASE